MQHIKQFKIIVNKGKVEDKDLKQDKKNIMDSVCEHLLIEGEVLLAETKAKTKAKNTIESITIWEEAKSEPKTTSKNKK